MLSQAILEWSMAGGTGRAARFRRRIAGRLRHELVKVADPDVTIAVGRYALRVPLSHNLPIYMSSFPLYDRFLERLCRQVVAARGRCDAIDIGANVGDTAAAILSVEGTRCLCLEADARYFSYLAGNAAQWGGRVELERCIVSDTDSTPGRMASERGTGRLELGQNAELNASSTLDDIIQRHPSFSRVDVLKIDTDGFDVKILRGAGNTIRRLKPVIFFEYYPDLLKPTTDRYETIFAFLHECGYDRALVFGNKGSYIFSFDLGNETAREDLCAFAEGGAVEYADVCVFPAEERRIADRVRKAEVDLAYGRTAPEGPVAELPAPERGEPVPS